MEDTSREQIDRLIDAGEVAGAAAALGRLWQDAPGPAVAAFVVSRFEQLRTGISFTRCRVAILRSFTVEPVVPLLRAMGFIGGIDLDVRLGEFNTYAQEILDTRSWLYAFSPDVVIVAVQTRDIAPGLWSEFADMDRAGALAAVEQALGVFRQLVRTFRQRCAAHLIIHALECPALPAQGVLDGGSELGQVAAIHKINDGIRELARSTNNAYLLDYNALIARRGQANWHDERMWVLARMPIAAGELIHLAREWLRYLHPITGRVCKVLVVDLDNTLWGGVIGEDGIDGIKLDDKSPGAAYRALQRAILDLHRRGVILAVCSKNNPSEAMQAIETHPGMVLRPGHFAAFRINWADKAANLREIAGELNVGLDSIAFLDDNPAERQWVRGQAPQVSVIELSTDSMRFAQALRESPLFERLELTAEDKSRGQFYAEQRMRTELQQSVSSLEDFYRSLQMRVKITPVDARSLSRAAQLTQKTNQFNLTTRRYSEQQLAEMLAAPWTSLGPSSGHGPRWRAFTLEVIDRFGDNGIVGVAILSRMEQICQIDTFLLSCRVIGRTVETAFLAALADDAAGAGATKLAGWFVPTKKNAPAEDFYSRHGFLRTQERDGASFWELDLAGRSLASPPWITLDAGV